MRQPNIKDSFQKFDLNLHIGHFVSFASDQVFYMVNLILNKIGDVLLVISCNNQGIKLHLGDIFGVV